jgi:hypothetical protein
VAEVTRAYLNFRIPPISTFAQAVDPRPVTLADQAEGASPLLLSSDGGPAATTWRRVGRSEPEVVRLYQAGRSLASIAREVGISWDSVARLLDRAGVRRR